MWSANKSNKSLKTRSLTTIALNLVSWSQTTRSSDWWSLVYLSKVLLQVILQEAHLCKVAVANLLWTDLKFLTPSSELHSLHSHTTVKSVMAQVSNLLAPISKWLTKTAAWVLAVQASMNTPSFICNCKSLSNLSNEKTKMHYLCKTKSMDCTNVYAITSSLKINYTRTSSKWSAYSKSERRICANSSGLIRAKSWRSKLRFKNLRLPLRRCKLDRTLFKIAWLNWPSKTLSLMLIYYVWPASIKVLRNKKSSYVENIITKMTTQLKRICTFSRESTHLKSGRPVQSSSLSSNTKSCVWRSPSQSTKLSKNNLR